MSTVIVPALKPLEYQGRSYVRGELVTARAQDALAMSRRGEVSLTKGAVVAPAPVVQRRDMSAEPEAQPTRRVRRRSRRYSRSDMTTESSPDTTTE